MSLWEGARRLPYFFTIAGGWEGGEADFVLCPQCALEHVEEPEPLIARYTTIRSVMCCRCGIVMGPINKAEMEADGE